MAADLLTNESSNTSSGTVGVSKESTQYLYGFGTFDTATLKLQESPDGGGTWFDVGSLTDKGKIKGDVPGGSKVRAELSSVGGSTSVTAVLVQGEGMGG